MYYCKPCSKLDPRVLPLQVRAVQRMWRDVVVVRRHQRQLLFMQLQRCAERHAAKLVRTGAAFLTSTLTATSANTTRKGMPCATLLPPPLTPNMVCWEALVIEHAQMVMRNCGVCRQQLKAQLQLCCAALNCLLNTYSDIQRLLGTHKL